MKSRYETDTLGQVTIPGGVYWGLRPRGQKKISILEMNPCPGK